MAPKTVKQIAVLAGLLATFVVVMVLGGGDTPAGTAPPPPMVPGRRGSAKPGADRLGDGIQIEALKAPRDAPAPERNLFRFECRRLPGTA